MEEPAARQAVSEAAKRAWADPVKREKRMAAMRLGVADSTYDRIGATRRAWADPEHRKERLKAHLEAVRKYEYEIAGIIYPSASEAAEALGLCVATIHYRARHGGAVRRLKTK